MERRWITEYDGADGVYAGPLLIADCVDFAVMLARDCVRAPDGQPLRVLGELVESIRVGDADVDVFHVMQ